MFSGCPSVRSLIYPLLTCTWVRWSTRPTVTVLRHVRPSISRHYKKSLLRSQIYHGYEELSTDTNYPIWRRQKLPYMKKTRKKKQVCGAACFMAAEIKFSEDVRPERFPGICRRMHGGNGLKFYMRMYLDHLQNWLVYVRSLLIFLILALFWLSETGQIWGFRAFPRERMEEMAWNFARWCILTTFRT